MWNPSFSPRPLAAPVFSAEALAIFSEMATPPSAARQVSIDIFVKALKEAGIWSLLDVMYVLAAADSQAALLNWKAPASFTAVPVNSPTFVADRGYTSNGTSSRLRTQYTPSTNGVNFVQDNCSMWVYCLTDVTETVGDIGTTGFPQTQIQARRTSTTLGWEINAASLSATATISTAVGLSGASRAISTTRKAWKNGVQLGADASVTSTGINANEQWICGTNPSGFSTKQIAFAAWGAALTGKEAAFYSAVLAYLQAIGAQ